MNKINISVEKTVPVAGKTMKSINMAVPEWKLNFDIMPFLKQEENLIDVAAHQEWYNQVLRVGHGAENTLPSDRSPAVFLMSERQTFLNSLHLHIRANLGTAKNGITMTSNQLYLNRWYNVAVTQKKNGQMHFFTVELDGQLIYQTIHENPVVFHDMKLSRHLNTNDELKWRTDPTFLMKNVLYNNFYQFEGKFQSSVEFEQNFKHIDILNSNIQFIHYGSFSFHVSCIEPMVVFERRLLLCNND